MSKTREREEFIDIMRQEFHTCPDLLERLRTLLRLARTHGRLQELACSSEAADRDRVPCPGYYAPGRCPCRDYGSGVYEGTEHGDVPRIAVQERRTEARIEAVCEGIGCTPIFQGDPRGCTVKLRVPSGRTNDFGGTGICVPQ